MPFSAATRLSVAFSVIVVLVGTACTAGLVLLSRADDPAAADNAASVLSLARDLRVHIAEVDALQARILLADGKSALVLRTAVERHDAEIHGALQKIQQAAGDAGGAAEGFAAAWSSYRTLQEAGRPAAVAAELSRTRASQAFAYAEAAMRDVIGGVEPASAVLGERAVQDMLRIQRLEKEMILEPGEADVGLAERQAEQAERALQAKLIRLDQSLPPAQRGAIHRFRDAWRGYLEVNREVHAAALAGPGGQAAADGQRQAVERALDAVLASAQRLLEERAAAREEARSGAMATSIELAAGALGIGLLIAVWSVVTIGRDADRLARRNDLLALDRTIALAEGAENTGGYASAAARLLALAEEREGTKIIPLRPDLVGPGGIAGGSRA